MPRVPALYEQPEVEIKPLAVPRMEDNGPNAMQILAKGGEHALYNIRLAAAKEAEEADTYRAEAQLNKLHAAKNEMEFGDQGAYKVKGEAVNALGKPFVSAYQEKFDEAATTLGNELANDNQKKKFQVAAMRLKTSFGDSLSRHEFGEIKAWKQSVFEGVVATENENMSRATELADPVERDNQLRASLDRVRDNAHLFYGQHTAMSKEAIDAKVLEIQSAMHKTVIDRMLEAHNPVGAKAYYDQNRPFINDKDGEKVRVQIEKDARGFKVNAAVEDVFGRLGPKNDLDAVQLDVMQKEIDKQFADDPIGRSLANTQLRERAQTHDYSVKERATAVTGGIWKTVLDNATIPQIRASPEFRSLDGRAQAVMLDQIEAFRRPDPEGAATLDQYEVYWAIVSNPAQMAKMSDADIFSLAPQMGASLVKQALQHKLAMSKQEDKVIEATLDVQDLRTFALQAGIDPSLKKNKNIMGEIQSRAETEIDAAQRAKGGKLLREDKQKILKRLLVEVPVKWVKNQGSPWFERTGVEPKRLYEVQYPENIVVPPADRAAIVQDLKNNGVVNPSESQIRGGYVRKLSSGPAAAKPAIVARPTSTAPVANTSPQARLAPTSIANPAQYGQARIAAGYPGGPPLETLEGRPLVTNPDGSKSHELSITIEADGHHMNIPTMFKGKRVTDDEAVAIMRKNNWIDPDTGKKVATFKTHAEALKAAQDKERRQNQEW